MELSYDDADLEPFLSEIQDDTLPPLSRLGSVLYLEARETFLSARHQSLLKAARERISQALEVEPRNASDSTGGADSPVPPRIQGTLFPDGPA